MALGERLYALDDAGTQLKIRESYLLAALCFCGIGASVVTKHGEATATITTHF